MPVPNYGVWIGHPTRYTAETAKQDPRSPHITLYFTSSHRGREHSAAINVKSVSRDSRLVFWIDRSFAHPITHHLAPLTDGFHPIDETTPVSGLDYLRTEGLFDIDAGTVLPHDIPGPNNDILDKMEPFLKKVLREKATLYVFGSSFGSGIHDVHMNQGSLPRFDNGVWQDGALLVRFPDGRWEAVFLAFASQRIPTEEETGEAAEGGRELAEILGV